MADEERMKVGEDKPLAFTSSFSISAPSSPLLHIPCQMCPVTFTASAFQPQSCFLTLVCKNLTPATASTVVLDSRRGACMPPRSLRGLLRIVVRSPCSLRGLLCLLRSYSRSTLAAQFLLLHTVISLIQHPRCSLSVAPCPVNPPVRHCPFQSHTLPRHRTKTHSNCLFPL